MGAMTMHLIRIHTVFHSDLKCMLTTGMLQVNTTEIGEDSACQELLELFMKLHFRLCEVGTLEEPKDTTHTYQTGQV